MRQFLITLFMFLILSNCKNSDNSNTTESGAILIAEKNFSIPTTDVQRFANTKSNSFSKTFDFSTGAKMKIEVSSIYTSSGDSAIKTIKVFETAKAKNHTSSAQFEEQGWYDAGNRRLGFVNLTLNNDKKSTQQNSKSIEIFANGTVNELKPESK